MANPYDWKNKPVSSAAAYLTGGKKKKKKAKYDPMNRNERKLMSKVDR